jgi:hypothetical protein
MKHRAALRKAGLRPIQIWVPDTRRSGIAAECRRQSEIIRNSSHEAETLAWLKTRSGPRGLEMGVKRGDLVTATLQGLVDAPLIRIRVEPSVKNGLQKPSQIMVDKT